MKRREWNTSTNKNRETKIVRQIFVKAVKTTQAYKLLLTIE